MEIATHLLGGVGRVEGVVETGLVATAQHLLFSHTTFTHTVTRGSNTIMLAYCVKHTLKLMCFIFALECIFHWLYMNCFILWDIAAMDREKVNFPAVIADLNTWIVANTGNEMTMMQSESHSVPTFVWDGLPWGNALTNAEILGWEHSGGDVHALPACGDYSRWSPRCCSESGCTLYPNNEK